MWCSDSAPQVNTAKQVQGFYMMEINHTHGGERLVVHTSPQPHIQKRIALPGTDFTPVKLDNGKPPFKLLLFKVQSDSGSVGV